MQLDESTIVDMTYHVCVSTYKLLAHSERRSTVRPFGLRMASGLSAGKMMTGARKMTCSAASAP